MPSPYHRQGGLAHCGFAELRNREHWGISGEGLQCDACLTPFMGVLTPRCPVFCLLREPSSVLCSAIFPVIPNNTCLFSVIPCVIVLISRGLIDMGEVGGQLKIERWKERMTGSPAAMGSWGGMQGSGGGAEVVS